MHLHSRKKAVYSPPAEGQVNVGQANVGPTAPAGPVYEEVSPKEEIEINTNHAYGTIVTVTFIVVRRWFKSLCPGMI